MKTKILALSLACLSSSVFAQNNFYGKLSIGKADHEVSSQGTKLVAADDTSMGITAGYQFHENFSVEVSYQNFGEATRSYFDEFSDIIGESSKAKAFDFGVRGTLPVNELFSLNARLGLSIWDWKYEETDSSFPGEVFGAKDDGTDLYFGIGAEYRINENTLAGINYSILDAEIEVLGTSFDYEIETISLSISVEF